MRWFNGVCKDKSKKSSKGAIYLGLPVRPSNFRTHNLTQVSVTPPHIRSYSRTGVGRVCRTWIVPLSVCLSVASRSKVNQNWKSSLSLKGTYYIVLYCIRPYHSLKKGFKDLFLCVLHWYLIGNMDFWHYCLQKKLRELEISVLKIFDGYTH